MDEYIEEGFWTVVLLIIVGCVIKLAHLALTDYGEEIAIAALVIVGLILGCLALIASFQIIGFIVVEGPKRIRQWIDR